jgi:hypothetical protein
LLEDKAPEKDHPIEDALPAAVSEDTENTQMATSTSTSTSTSTTTTTTTTTTDAMSVDAPILVPPLTRPAAPPNRKLTKELLNTAMRNSHFAMELFGLRPSNESDLKDLANSLKLVGNGYMAALLKVMKGKANCLSLSQSPTLLTVCLALEDWYRQVIIEHVTRIVGEAMLSLDIEIEMIEDVVDSLALVDPVEKGVARKFFLGTPIKEWSEKELAYFRAQADFLIGWAETTNPSSSNDGNADTSIRYDSDDDSVQGSLGEDAVDLRVCFSPDQPMTTRNRKNSVSNNNSSTTTTADLMSATKTSRLFYESPVNGKRPIKPVRKLGDTPVQKGYPVASGLGRVGEGFECPVTNCCNFLSYDDRICGGPGGCGNKVKYTAGSGPSIMLERGEVLKLPKADGGGKGAQKKKKKKVATAAKKKAPQPKKKVVTEKTVEVESSESEEEEEEVEEEVEEEEEEEEEEESEEESSEDEGFDFMPMPVKFTPLKPVRAKPTSKPSWKPSSKAAKEPKRVSRRCNECRNCVREECGSCKNCADMVKFGGKGSLKKKCVKRECLILRKEVSSGGSVSSSDDDDEGFDSDIEAEEKLYIKTLRDRRVMAEREKREAAEHEKEYEQLEANERFFHRNKKKSDRQLQREAEMKAFIESDIRIVDPGGATSWSGLQECKECCDESDTCRFCNNYYGEEVTKFDAAVEDPKMMPRCVKTEEDAPAAGSKRKHFDDEFVKEYNAGWVVKKRPRSQKIKR